MKLINCHSHKAPNDGCISICNIRINNDTLHLSHLPNLYFSVGIHPWDIREFQSSWLDKLTMLLNYQQVVALGECGFDKNTTTTLDQQMIIFENQILISETLRKPVIIHCVSYFNELIKLKKRLRPKQVWIIHGFRGKPQLAQQLIEEGFYISFGEKFNPESVMITPPDRILTESDESELNFYELTNEIARIKQCKPDDFNAASVIFGI